MAEEFENYEALAEEARRRVERWESEDPQGVALAEDLQLLDHRLSERVEGVLDRFEELHTRLWRLEDRVAQLDDRMQRLEALVHPRGHDEVERESSS